MGVDINMNWSISDWRRFFGFPDMTSLIELASLANDRLSLAMVHQYLENSEELNALIEKGAEASGRGVTATKQAEDCRVNQPINDKPQNA